MTTLLQPGPTATKSVGEGARAALPSSLQTQVTKPAFCRDRSYEWHDVSVAWVPIFRWIPIGTCRELFLFDAVLTPFRRLRILSGCQSRPSCVSRPVWSGGT